MSLTLVKSNQTVYIFGTFFSYFLDLMFFWNCSVKDFKVSPRLETFLSIICNLFFVKLLFFWGVYGSRNTDVVRQSLTLLTDALKILVKGGIEGETTVKFPSLGFFFLCGFSFTNIHESQDCRKRGRAFL